jgi:hypothetical protein
MIERRQHPPECLRQEEWGEIKAFVQNTSIYRSEQKDLLSEIRKENKERFEILLNQIRADKVDNLNQFDLIISSIHSNDNDKNLECQGQDKRIRALEFSRAFITGAVVLITTAIIPIALAIMK